jgi:tuftelin-interacting protein 11
MMMRSTSDCLTCGRTQSEYSSEFRALKLGSFLFTLLLPRCKVLLADWSPLVEPERGFQQFKRWKRTLDHPECIVEPPDGLVESNGAAFFSSTGMAAASVQSTVRGADGKEPEAAAPPGNAHQPAELPMTVYERLLWDVWLPSVRSSLTAAWDVRNVEPAVTLLERWAPVLPLWIGLIVADQVVLPRLQQAVEHWDARRDTMPVHTWLHPWLPLLGDRMNCLNVPLRHRFAQALLEWEPDDGSALAMVRPWKSVWSPADMSAFLLRSIIPKLHLLMEVFVVNPQVCVCVSE